MKIIVFPIVLILLMSIGTAEIWRDSGSISNSFTTPPYPTVIKQTGFEKNFNYETKLLPNGDTEITVCHKNYDKNKNNPKLNDYKPEKKDIAGKKTKKDKGLNLKTQPCDKHIEKLEKGEILKFGEESTEIILTEHNVTFTITPEYQACDYLKCRSEILVRNDNDHNISVSVSDLSSTLGTISTYIMQEDTISACLDEECNEKINKTIYNYVYTDSGTVYLSPGESHTFYIDAILSEPQETYKYDVTILYLGQNYTIDPYFTTTGSGFNGTFYRTYLNASGFVQLNLSYTYGNYTELYDLGINATTQWNNISWNSSIYNQSLPDNNAVERYDGANMTNNLILYHCEDSASPISDSSGNGITGVYNGATFQQPGKYNDGLPLWANESGYIVVSDQSSINFGTNTDFSILLWLKRDSLGAKIIVDKRTQQTDGFGLFFDSQNELALWLNGTRYETAGTTVINDGWHLIGLVIDRDTGGSFWIDGTEYALIGATNTDNVSTSADLYIGQRPFGMSPGIILNGTIDEWALFDRALTDNEVIDIYKRGIVQLSPRVRSCDNGNCGAWDNLDITSPQTINVADNKQLQFSFDLKTTVAGYTPQLWGVSVGYSGECVPSWQQTYTSCLINDTRIKYYIDANDCNTSVGYPGNGSESCNYCDSNIIQTLSACTYNGTAFNRQRGYIDTYYNSCCAVTNLTSDCQINQTPYNVTISEPCTQPVENNLYLTLGVLILGVIMVMIFIADRLDFMFLKNSAGQEIPIMKYLVWLVSGWLLLIVANIALHLTQLGDVALYESVLAFYRAILYIMIFVSALWIIGFMMNVLQLLGFIGGVDNR